MATCTSKVDRSKKCIVPGVDGLAIGSAAREIFWVCRDILGSGKQARASNLCNVNAQRGGNAGNRCKNVISDLDSR